MKNLFLNFKTSENENILVKMLSFSLSKPNVLRGWHRNEGKTILSTEYYKWPLTPEQKATICWETEQGAGLGLNHGAVTPI